jgi:transcription elongation factor Elf1
MNEDDYALKIAQGIIDRAHEKYQKENTCPMCGSHDVDFDLLYICGPHSGWVEWCNSCGWLEETKT